MAIAKRLADQDKSNIGWQRDLIVSLYKVGTITAKIGGNDKVTQAQGLLRTDLNLAQLYSGPDRQKLIDALNQALRQLVIDWINGCQSESERSEKDERSQYVPFQLAFPGIAFCCDLA
jgi:hypothetical protein